MPTSTAGNPDFDKIIHPNARAFLAAFAKTGNVTVAARVARVKRQNHYNWLESVDGYREAFEAAREMAGDLLEEAARKRAVDGYLVPIYQRGKHVGNERHYSDSLLTVLLKGAKPDKYKERVENQHKGRVEYAHSLDGDLDALSVEEERALRDIARKLAAEGPEGGAPVA
ncbi:MAG: hypothetical protein JO250_09180 [Armatimonadetes bacterium]|nr:hypothetical protein [Armatimonadota bacterium]